MALIARKLNVTREHLTRVFHSQTGTTPGQFAIQERMKRAAKMLQDNRFSCKEIAERLGYGSSSSFARAFKSYYSVSPAEYKQKPVSIPSISVYTEKVSDFPRQYNEYAAELLKDARERFEKYDPCGEFGKNHS